MSDSRLSDFQVELANVFFALPESAGFLLAGGGALIAQGIVPRPTEDLDFFTSRRAGSVEAASEALIAAVTARGWSHKSVRTGEEFRRWSITGPETVLVDLAVDNPAASTPTVTIAGPSFAADELAIRKTLAMFAATLRTHGRIQDRTSRMSAFPSPTSAPTSTPGPTKSTRVSRPPERTLGRAAPRSAGSPARSA